MTKEELEKATGQELIDARNYCGVDGYYGDYLDNVNAEMLKRFNRLAELEVQIEKMKCCGNCKYYQFQNDAGYYTCTRDGKCNGKNYRSCEFNLEKWEGR